MHRTIARGAAPRRGGAQNFRWLALWTWRWARTLAVLGGPVKRDPRAGRESHAGGIFARSRAGARWETCKESRGASISCSGCKVKWTLGCQISEQRLTESPLGTEARLCRARGARVRGPHLYHSWRRPPSKGGRPTPRRWCGAGTSPGNRRAATGSTRSPPLPGPAPATCPGEW